MHAKNIPVSCVSVCMQRIFQSRVRVCACEEYSTIMCMKRMCKAFGCVNHRVVTLVTDSVQRQWLNALIGNREVDRS